MGIRNTVELICDYPECRSGKGGSHLSLSWCTEDVASGKSPLPEDAKTFVTFKLNGQDVAFCSRLHAAKFFLPPGYEIKQSGLQKFPEEKWTGPVLADDSLLSPDNKED